MTGRREFLGRLALVGAAGAAGCLGGDGSDGGNDGGGDDGGRPTPTTVGPGEFETQATVPDESENGRSLPSALQVVSAVGTNVEARRIGTVEVTLAKADWVEQVDLTDLTVVWTVPGDSYELAAAAADTDADGYFGTEPVTATAADAVLKTSDERYRWCSTSATTTSRATTGTGGWKPTSLTSARSCVRTT